MTRPQRTASSQGGSTLVAVLAGVGLVAVAAAAFALTRPHEDQPPPTTTTTTFPRAAYVEAIAGALRERVQVDLGPGGAECIANAMVVVLGESEIESVAELTDPLAQLRPVERERVLQIVVGCLDPEVAEQLLGGSPAATQPSVTLPTEDFGG